MNFTRDELRRIQRTLRKRHRVTRKSNIRDIGFGLPVAAGQLARRGRLTVCYFVRRKRSASRGKDRIPPLVSFRLRRGKRFVACRLPTDVVEVKRIRLTGRRVVCGRRTVTTGAVVSWKAGDESRREWGVLTVGHGFRSLSRMAAAQRVVRIQSRAGTHFPGTIIARSPRRSRVDAALIRVRRADLTAHQILPPNRSGRTGARSVDRLSQDLGAPGTTRPRRRDLPFRVHAFLPAFDLVDQLGSLSNVLSVLGAPEGAFAPGASGSVFTVKDQASAIQVAGTPDSYQAGFGQALVDVLAWAEKDRRRRGAKRGVSLQLVAVF